LIEGDIERKFLKQVYIRQRRKSLKDRDRKLDESRYRKKNEKGRH